MELAAHFKKDHFCGCWNPVVGNGLFAGPEARRCYCRCRWGCGGSGDLEGCHERCQKDKMQQEDEK